MHNAHARTLGACAACPYGASNFTAPTGTIAIPPAGTATYANRAVCDYIITTGAPIYLRFDSFGTEANWDFVKVYDGTSAAGALKGAFSGTAIPPFQVAASGSMFIRFTSDGGTVSRGVAMTWLDTIPAGPTPSPTIVGQAEPADAAGA
jgi:hypothetical protein